MTITRGALFLLLLPLACMGRACGETVDSSTVDFSTIKAHYETSHKGSEPEKIQVELTFTSAQTQIFDTIRFNEGEHFYVNGKEIKYDDFSYRTSIEIEPDVSGVKIVFKDKAGEAHGQGVLIAPAISWVSPSPESSVDVAQGFTSTYSPEISATASLIWGDRKDDDKENDGWIVIDGENGLFSFGPFLPVPPSGKTLEVQGITRIENPGIPNGFVAGSIDSEFETETLKLKAE